MRTWAQCTCRLYRGVDDKSSAKALVLFTMKPGLIKKYTTLWSGFILSEEVLQTSTPMFSRGTNSSESAVHDYVPPRY